VPSPELRQNGKRLGLCVETLHDPAGFEQTMVRWQPTVIAMDLVVAAVDSLELLYGCVQLQNSNHLILMSSGFELYLKMAEEIAASYRPQDQGQVAEAVPAEQSAYLLMFWPRHPRRHEGISDAVVTSS